MSTSSVGNMTPRRKSASIGYAQFNQNIAFRDSDSVSEYSVTTVCDHCLWSLPHSLRMSLLIGNCNRLSMDTARPRFVTHE
jgi:hypothetical protein